MPKYPSLLLVVPLPVNFFRAAGFESSFTSLAMDGTTPDESS